MTPATQGQTTQTTPVNANGGMSEVEMLRARVAELEAQLSAKVRFGVSEKGAISVYGLGQYPTTLYLSQWIPLIQAIKADLLDKFITENKDKLATKPAK